MSRLSLGTALLTLLSALGCPAPAQAQQDDACPPCMADCDGSGTIDLFDFLCFQNLFSAGDLCADCDEDGALDLFDLLCFQMVFSSGCPELKIIELGVEPPPAVLCSLKLTSFPPDDRPLDVSVRTVPTPIGGDLRFERACKHFRVGSGWSAWSHGYTGDVYRTGTEINITVPPNSAFSLYADSSLYFGGELDITGSIGGRAVHRRFTIDSAAGAKGFAFCGGVELVTIKIRVTFGYPELAVGEFGIAK
ncbi:MAG: hypothetical protein ACF8R7_03625 [Phycisphaerales bacterium JB039]